MASRALPGFRHLVALLVVAPAFSPPVLAAQNVQGRVLDQDPGGPVPTAVVELVGAAEEEPAARAVADPDGRFSLDAPAPGRYSLRAERIGYEATTTQAFDLVDDEEPFRVELRLGAEAVPLEPMEIVSDRPARLHPRLYATGYYERRSHWGTEGLGLGHFLEGEEIERTNPFRVSDVLREIPGVQVSGVGGRRQGISMRQPDPSGGRCVPIVYVDGTATAGPVTDEVVDINELVAVPDLVAVEVYPGLSQPARFTRFLDPACGVVALWTGDRSAEMADDLFGPQEEKDRDVSVELRAGPAIGTFGSGTDLHWAPRVSARATVDLRVSSGISVYGGASLVPFGCEREGCVEQDARFRSRGAEAGVRVQVGVWSEPWLRLGVVRHRLRADWEDRGEPLQRYSPPALGFEASAGVQMPLGWRGVSLTPGLRYVRYATPEEVRLLTLDVGLRRTF